MRGKLRTAAVPAFPSFPRRRESILDRRVTPRAKAWAPAFAGVTGVWVTGVTPALRRGGRQGQRDAGGAGAGKRGLFRSAAVPAALSMLMYTSPSGGIDMDKQDGQDFLLILSILSIHVSTQAGT